MNAPKLRWVYSKNKITAAMVSAERDRTNDRMDACKDRLTALTPKRLQVWNGDWWEDIPTVCELTDPITKKYTEVEE